ncbi:hypothetical protein CCR85_03095 [Rhodothalassium salexigens]|uniref:efflux RND transporter periplasmic adaptor subunit n=1 Tax=Rhodothalassium salexigens TaxID=1086 RepID=UPI001911E923|nr:efflux RND transporter periplasmic adaptor subunit [Rhodothalassium salexigens]MBK5910478.1 hypothetical protein [Rhodothalassium salexigens]MBK5921704.1 hypothetical protein [Rhodothalassium salexigens]
MRKAFTLLLLLFAAALVAGGVYLIQRGPQGQQGAGFRGAGPVSVEVATVGYDQFADEIEAIGTAIADESVTITARVSESVEEVHFDDGDRVDAGDVLVSLTDDEEVAQFTEAEARLKEAEQQLARIQDLVKRGNASKAARDEAVREVSAFRSQVEAARARVDDRRITAPFGGVLGLRRVSPGTLVSPGDEITTLDDVQPLKVDFAVPERFIADLAVGQAVSARVAAFPGRTFDGTMRTISSRVDPVSRAVTARAILPNPDSLLRPGMLMSVILRSNQRRSLAVSEDALVPVDDNQYVYVVRADNTVERRRVDVGARRPGVAEIRDGLDAGEKVVTAGTLRMRPGLEIRILREDGAPAGADDQAATATAGM